MCGRHSNNQGEAGGTAMIRCSQSDKTWSRGGKAQSRGGKAATWRPKVTGGCEIGQSNGVEAGEEDGGGADGYNLQPESTLMMPAMMTAVILLLRINLCVILSYIPCILYSLHCIHLLGDPKAEQDMSEGRGSQMDASDYSQHCE